MAQQFSIEPWKKRCKPCRRQSRPKPPFRSPDPRSPEMRSFKIERPTTAFTLASRYRRPRQRAGLHLKWIRTLPCPICGRRGNIHAAHLRAASLRHGKLASGIAQKPDDAWTLPLCLNHHILGEEAQHRTQELTFWESH